MNGGVLVIFHVIAKVLEMLVGNGYKGIVSEKEAGKHCMVKLDEDIGGSEIPAWPWESRRKPAPG